MDIVELQKAAEKISYQAYAPYSHFRVGAALLCSNGEIVCGCNVENRSFGLTNCAERSALFTAVSRGITHFKGIAIYSPDAHDLLSPCGACRQVLSEFCGPDFPVYMHGPEGWECQSLETIFPFDSLQHLKES